MPTQNRSRVLLKSCSVLLSKFAQLPSLTMFRRRSQMIHSAIEKPKQTRTAGAVAKASVRMNRATPATGGRMPATGGRRPARPATGRPSTRDSITAPGPGRTRPDTQLPGLSAFDSMWQLCDLPRMCGHLRGPLRLGSV